ncbi:type II secretion system F family protein [Gordonia sp. (in: high G+C Gram-positive bacteria)]|uniref:type II secretion system F family protein n=1 Tax=Gordonia sp. (in: high G+C Gram-positive bacteria) TaxID=84139 RepID=UPI0016A98663|nr:type II secretion system F family protein [Gordonia sp. (in: high G+C Gram-positive bacteria)]NLG46516.1 type II secretion system F family protein [Gordonia sp. (in: high G+C Gram-positive bacteria)]
MMVPFLLLAAALLAWPSPEWVLRRASVAGGATAAPEGAGGEPDPFDLAAGYDTLAVCLRAGLPLATAAQVAAHASPPQLRQPFLRAADLLALGSDPERAWATKPTDMRDFADLAALVRRASRAGSALAEAVAGFADGTRRRAENEALEAAERAGVKISGPLGLCFLPAFVCLGIVPVVIGLASELLVGL